MFCGKFSQRRCRRRPLARYPHRSGKRQSYGPGLCERMRIGTVGTRFDNCLTEQAVRSGRSQQISDRHSSGGLAKDCHVCGVAPKCADVPLHPSEQEDLIHQPVISDRHCPRAASQCGMGQETKAPQSIVERDNHDAMTGKCRSVVYGKTRRALCKTAAVNPNHDRQRPAAFDLRCPYVCGQAIFAELIGQRRVFRIRGLFATLAELLCTANPVPACNRLGRHPTEVSQWRRGIWDALIDRYVADRRTGHIT